MRSAQAALRASLVALAAALAALLAHVTIDFAGDFLLARDSYDNVDHQSRTVFALLIAAFAIVAAARLFFELLDRRCDSTQTLLRTLRAGLGSPLAFVLQTAVLAAVTLAGMEFFDCVATGTKIDDITDLFGGSLALGLGVTLSLGMLAGFIVHGLARLIAAYEPVIAALIVRLAGACDTSARVSTVRRRIPQRTMERALLLARRGSKRGPPLLAPG